jgi:hypothetical protein
VAVDLESTASAVPDIETAEATTSDVDSTVEQELEQAEQKTPGPTRPESAPEVKVDSRQFGQKVGYHAKDYGLDKTNPADRAWIRGHIDEIGQNPDEVRQGNWNPEGGGATDDYFFRRGEDVVVTKSDGTFVTILKGGINNGWFNRASVVK